MNFFELSTYFEKLEATSSRNSMTEILSDLFKKTIPADIDKICYLLQGRVAPLYEPVEFGVADKMVIRALAFGMGIETGKVLVLFKKLGDLGTTASELKKNPPLASQAKLFGAVNVARSLSISYVFEKLTEIAHASGAGSQEKKINLLAELLSQADVLSVRYIVRIPLGKLRLGFSDMTILDALSWMIKGDKSLKKKIEAAYHVRPDLGFIARVIKEKGILGLTRVHPQPGTPILMARANRLSSAGEIFEKIGECAVEYKYDGLRLQVHLERKTSSGKREVKIKMFSRNLENITDMFPDIAQAVTEQVEGDQVIFEGEVVAYNPKTGVFVPFQETMQRKRKYDIATKALEIPVKLFVFELLLFNKESYLGQPYIKRKAKLKTIIKKGNTLVYAQEKVTGSESEVDEMFESSVKLHFEGIIAKKLDGVYEAGVRGWNWIKYKKAMNVSLNDTLDVVVMGYTLGEGKRTSFGVGQFLTGIYDGNQDKFVTVSKIGTGLTDEQFREFIVRIKKLKAKEKPPLYDVDKLLTPDVWLDPQLVVEVSCDEITRSAVHTAGRVLEPSKSGKAFSVKTPGFALRFPRLVRFRDDRRPEDATSVKEVVSMFVKQGKH